VRIEAAKIFIILMNFVMVIATAEKYFVVVIATN